MTLQTSQKSPLHINVLLKTILLEFNSEHFAKAEVTAENACHSRLCLRSCLQHEHWTTLTFPKHMQSLNCP